jgi:hypothetical protein
LVQERRTLVAESGLNRLVLQAEIQNLRDATAWVSEAARWPRKAGPLLLLVAPLAGFLMAKGSRRPDSWLNKLALAAKWIGPLYTLWKSFSASRTQAETGDPAS